MRIAVVGKGGSGKSTISALTTLALSSAEHIVVAVDADVNMHLPLLLAPQLSFPVSKLLSSGDSPQTIRQYLRGDNNRITSLETFVKTTPPASGSRIITLKNSDDPFLDRWSTLYADIPLMVVGTYEEDKIGTSCYHNNLGVLENIISHCDDREAFLVVDMVAGTDAFANSLFCQFDLIILVVEASRQSTEVAKRFLSLAKASEIEDRVLVLANKITDATDSAFIERTLERTITSTVMKSDSIRSLEQENIGLGLDALDSLTTDQLNLLVRIITEKNSIPYTRKLEELYTLHTKYCAQGYIRDRLGDLSTQIDSAFSF